jgi:hypothetical protein
MSNGNERSNDGSTPSVCFPKRVEKMTLMSSYATNLAILPLNTPATNQLVSGLGRVLFGSAAETKR